MAQLSNWECPAGTGKKMKFCCPDLVGDWEKILRLLEAQQYHACLELIDQVGRRSPDRACLWAIKIETLYQSEKVSEAEQTVEEFLQKHPENPAALMEKAYLLARREQPEEAYRWLLQGMNNLSISYPICTSRSLFSVAAVLLAQGHYVPALALLRFGAQLPGPMQEDLQDSARALDANRNIPLVLRESFGWRSRLLAHSPAAASFSQIRQQVNQGHWLEATQQLQQLIQTYPEVPGLWWHLALLRSWILDTPAAIEALRKYAHLDVPREEAILAEAVALALSEDPLEDQIATYKLIYIPEDESHLQGALALCKQVVPVKADMPTLPQEADGDGPPRICYLLLNRPLSGPEEAGAEPLVFGVLGLAALYGRQTDREARLVIYDVSEHSRGQVEALLQQFVGQGLRPQVVVQQTGQASATQTLFRLGVIFSGAKGQPPDPDQEAECRLREFLSRWLDQPLGILQGRTPRQAAQEPGWQTALEAVLLWVEHLALQQRYPWNRGRVRQELALPPPEPIDLRTVPLQEVPLYRWVDMDLSEVSDEQISNGYLYATHFRWPPAVNQLASAFLDRPNLAHNPLWLSACYAAAATTMPSQKAGSLIEQGRQRALQWRQSCAPWDLLALQYHLHRQDAHQIDPLVRHLLEQHQYESGVLEQVIELLESFGVLPGEPTEQSPGGPASGSLWTPGQEEKPASGKKLWTPGMS